MNYKQVILILFGFILCEHSYGQEVNPAEGFFHHPQRDSIINILYGISTAEVNHSMQHTKWRNERYLTDYFIHKRTETSFIVEGYGNFNEKYQLTQEDSIYSETVFINFDADTFTRYFIVFDKPCIMKNTGKGNIFDILYASRNEDCKESFDTLSTITLVNDSGHVPFKEFIAIGSFFKDLGIKNIKSHIKHVTLDFWDENDDQCYYGLLFCNCERDHSHERVTHSKQWYSNRICVMQEPSIDDY